MCGDKDYDCFVDLMLDRSVAQTTVDTSALVVPMSVLGLFVYSFPTIYTYFIFSAFAKTIIVVLLLTHTVLFTLSGYSCQLA
jgi:hypothetical protein